MGTKKFNLSGLLRDQDFFTNKLGKVTYSPRCIILLDFSLKHAELIYGNWSCNFLPTFLDSKDITKNWELRIILQKVCGLSGPTRLVIWNLCPPSLLFKKSCPLGLLLFFIFLDFLLDWSRSVNQYLHIVLRLFYWWTLMYRFCRLRFVLSLCNSGRKHSYVGQLASTNTLKSMIKQPNYIIWKLNLTLQSHMIFKT